MTQSRDAHEAETCGLLVLDQRPRKVRVLPVEHKRGVPSREIKEEA